MNGPVAVRVPAPNTRPVYFGRSPIEEEELSRRVTVMAARRLARAALDLEGARHEIRTATTLLLLLAIGLAFTIGIFLLAVGQ